MKIKFLMLFAILLVIPLVIAQSVYRQGEDIDLKVPCINSGDYCSSSAMCNLTTMYPNESLLVNNQQMTNQISFHNFTLNGTEIDVTGDYKNVMRCKDGNYNGTSTFSFPVTLSGTEEPTDKGTILIGIFIVVFGIACVFLFLSDRMTEVGPKLFFLLGAFVFLLGSVGIIAVVAFDSNLTTGINNIIGNILFALGMVFYILFGYIMIRETVAVLDLYREKKYFGTEAY